MHIRLICVVYSSYIRRRGHGGRAHGRPQLLPRLCLCRGGPPYHRCSMQVVYRVVETLYIRLIHIYTSHIHCIFVLYTGAHGRPELFPGLRLHRGVSPYDTCSMKVVCIGRINVVCCTFVSRYIFVPYTSCIIKVHSSYARRALYEVLSSCARRIFVVCSTCIRRSDWIARLFGWCGGGHRRPQLVPCVRLWRGATCILYPPN